MLKGQFTVNVHVNVIYIQHHNSSSHMTAIQRRWVAMAII